MFGSYVTFYDHARRFGRPSVAHEALRDVFRRQQLRAIDDVTFYTPEIRGLNYADRNAPKAAGFQVVVSLVAGSRDDPRWAVSLQQKSFAKASDLYRSHAVAELNNEKMIAPSLTTEAAFRSATDTYDHVMRNIDDVRAGYDFDLRILDNVPPIPVTGRETHPLLSIYAMPAYEQVKLGTTALEQRRTQIIDRLRTTRMGGYAPVLR